MPAASPQAGAQEFPEIVKKLQKVDDKYLALEKEYEAEVSALLVKYMSLRKPIFKDRVSALTAVPKDADPKGDENSGTPGLKSFWLQALLNHPDVQNSIFEYDEEVLEYLKDITLHLVDKADAHSGFKLVFHFARNPFFRNRELEKEYKVTRPCPFRDELDVEEVKASEIEWRSGKNVTVEYVRSKESKNGTTKEPRPSFFRNWFCSLKKGEAIPKMLDEYEYAEGDEEQEFLERLMQSDYEVGAAIRDYIVPHAVRWYTGEACPPMDHDDYSDDESYCGESDYEGSDVEDGAEQ